MSRGIISIYWGDETKLPIERLKASLKRFHPELPHEIIKIEAPVGDDSSLNRKAAMHEMTPFDETLYLDIDTVVMGNLDFGFCPFASGLGSKPSGQGPGQGGGVRI